jgi:Flp pilus assembly protein TadG
VRWLRRPGWPTTTRAPEHGAVTVLVAVVLGGGVLMGASAVAVDVGRLYAEREQLQSGADAAALAVAQACAAAPANCATNAGPLAGGYANGNANDNTSAVRTLCGRGAGLSACPSDANNLTACLGAAPATGSYVEVRTATRLTDGSTLLPPSVAQAITGNTGYQGHQVAACARAAWGAPGSGAGAAITFSRCEWNTATANGTSYQSTSNPSSVGEVAFHLHEPGGTAGCPAGPAGWDTPGGFGWLNETAGPCMSSMTAGGTYGGDTGVSASQACRTQMALWRTDRTVLYIPIYDAVHGQGTGTTYQLAGLAAFVLTGYNLSGFRAQSWLSDRHLCNGSDRCVYGYFVRGVLTTPATSGGPDFGASIVMLVG